MTSQHAFGYSKSTRAKCHAPTPCQGTPLDVGTLRYGSTTPSGFGQTVEWRHWGCVTPAILNQLATLPVDEVPGFKDLAQHDQSKIRKAVSLCMIDPADIPRSFKPSAALAGASNSSLQKKRKAEFTASPATPGEENADDVPNEEARDELYCTMNTSVVGIQYYKGMVGPGEEVMLVREPQNSYDANAVQVKNISGVQVGHLPRQVVTKLAPLLDHRLVTVEGVINDGNITSGARYNLSITLRIYGGADIRDSLEPLLVWATPRQRGFQPRTSASGSRPTAAVSAVHHPAGSSQRRANSVTQRPGTSGRTTVTTEQQEVLRKAAELRQMLTTFEKVDDEGRRNSLLDTLCSTNDVLSLPLHPNPPGIKNGDLKVDLLKHQSQALQWCIEREYPVLPERESDKPVQFWQLRKNGGKSYYYNIATKTPQEVAPSLGRGALCADAMGLGKTLTMLALILATKTDVPKDFSKTTLIVAPLSVLSNWEKQIADHCSGNSLTSYIYYDNNRTMNAAQLTKFDVVITTYQTIAGESPDIIRDSQAKKKKRIEKSLFDVPWKRIILDEGHTIRNPRTKMAKAVFALNAQRRWVLTGTPILNSPKDLGSLLTFLQICRPLDNEDFYKRLLLRPLKDGNAAGAELLRALMSHICIRRTKEMQDGDGKPLIPLPPVEMIVVPVALNDDARALYNEVEQASQQRFQYYMNSDTGSLVRSNVLSMLTRMRQLVLHPGLAPPNYLEELRAQAANEDAVVHRTTQLSPADIARLRGLLAQALEDFEECPICFNVLIDARITGCGHMFCLPCITEVILRDPKCPMDRRPLGMGDLYEPPPPTDLTQAPVQREQELDLTGIRGGSSAKIDQLVHLLRLNPTTEKSLVFSQFTSFLDKIANVLDAEGIPYVRFDGQMSAKRRQEAIARFSVPITERDIADEGDDDDFVDDMDSEPMSSRSRETRKQDKAKGRASIFTNNSHDSTPPKIMLLSLKAGAIGLNLTVANNVYLMDPWWQEGIESQAIDRVNRIGQTKPVRVFQLIAENTIEAKVLEIQERKKHMIQQAFSGIKRTETERHRREARLQDLVELFGLGQQQP